MAFDWNEGNNPLLVGDTIYADTVNEMRDYLDEIDDNTACVTNDATIHNGADDTADNGDYGTNQGTEYGTRDDADDATVYNPQYSTEYSDKDSSINGANYSNDDAGLHSFYDSTENNSRNNYLHWSEDTSEVGTKQTYDYVTVYDPN